MLRIDLTVENTRRWNPFQRRRFELLLPQSWAELSPRRRRRYWRWTVGMGQVAAQRRALRQALRDVPRSMRRHISLDDRAAMLSAFSWMEIKPDATPVFPEFRHGGQTYFLPRAKFENGTCVEFAIADGYYEAFMKKPNPQTLINLVATLCREAHPDEQRHLTTGDVRVAIVRRDEAEHRAKSLQTLPSEIVYAVLLYFAGVKLYIHQTYWMLFDQEQPEVQEGEENLPKPGPRFGWWSRFMEIAESGLFGDYMAVMQTRLHLVCMYLVDQHQKNERLKAEYRKAGNSNTTDS